MRFLRRESDEARRARTEREREDAESMSELEAGRLPVAARKRLAEQSMDAGFFTSDLSTNEHLLVRQGNFEPVGQVMGSAFCRVAYRGYLGRTRLQSGEVANLTEAQLTARSRAVSRLKQEATLLGADGVVCVRLSRGEREWGSGHVEFTAIGTAIRLSGAPPGGSGDPFTCALSGQEFAKLSAAGYQPTEIAFGVCSYYIHSDRQARAVANSIIAGMVNQEMRLYTAGLQTARELAMRRFSQEARRSGGVGAVGVTIDWDAEEIEYEVNNIKYVDLLVHFSAVGSAIAERAGTAPAGLNTLTFYDLKEGRSVRLSSHEE